ncbi:MAG: hypothetical protein KDK55_06755 [Chlamydiia bacterium]|nr:hypothetical protein [Chlamydiia bacterium]
MKKALFRGTFLAGLGASLLFLSYMMMPPSTLKLWGFPTVLIGFLFILSGMIPYKRLSSLETMPHEIHLDSEFLSFFLKGTPLFRVKLEFISDVNYTETKEIYGLSIQLKRPAHSAITLLQSHQQFATFTAWAKQKMPHVDLFLPYFSKNTEEEIKNSITYSVKWA